MSNNRILQNIDHDWFTCICRRGKFEQRWKKHIQTPVKSSVTRHQNSYDSRSTTRRRLGLGNLLCNISMSLCCGRNLLQLRDYAASSHRRVQLRPCYHFYDWLRYDYNNWKLVVLKLYEIESPWTLINKKHALFIAVLYGVTQLVGVFVAGFIDICGCRSLCIGGALLGAISFSIAAFLPSNIGLFMIVYAVFGGIGHGTITIVSVIICTKYFSKKRALSVGISR